MPSDSPEPNAEERSGQHVAGNERPGPGDAAPPILPEHQPGRAHVRQGRLHPISPLFALIRIVRGILIPVIILLVLGRDRMLGGFILVFISIPMAIALVRYFTFRYWIEGGELVTRQGLFSSTERKIPLSRVQDIRIEQGMLQRFWHVADVHVDTAGGEGAEASLSVLAKAEAERLRALIFEQKAANAGAAAVGAPPPATLVGQLSLRDLIKAGLTSNHLASTAAIFAVIWGLLDDIMPRDMYEAFIVKLVNEAGTWTQLSGTGAWAVYACAVALVLGVGMIFSVCGSIILFYGFTLTRRGGDLHRHYGLFTRRSSSLPSRRIQVLKIEERFLRRWQGLATLRADTAGGRSNHPSEDSKGGRDVLLPILEQGRIESVLPAIFPDLEPETGQWRQVSRRAIRRGVFKGTAVCLTLAAGLGLVEREWWGWWPLTLIPLVYWLNVMSYRHLGYWLGLHYFRTRRGWLSRAGHVVPVRNIQSIILRQTPFDRRHGVFTLHVDTAGQAFTGGGPHIGNVPATEAIDLGWLLARQAAGLRFRW